MSADKTKADEVLTAYKRVNSWRFDSWRADFGRTAMAGIFVLEVLMQLSCYRALATHASNKFHSENFSVPDFLGGVTSFKFHIPHTDLFFATKLIYLKH